MRIFIGIPFPDSFKTDIGQMQSELKPLAEKGKWTDPNNLHLTLLFIGEMDQKHIEHLNRHLAHDLSNQKSFFLVTSRLESFKKKDEHILFIGVSDGSKELESLARKICESARRADIPFVSSSFTPHITFARSVISDKIDTLFLYNFMTHIIPVNQVHLYLSHQINGKLSYTPLYTYRLN